MPEITNVESPSQQGNVLRLPQALVYALPTLPVALLYGSIAIIQGIYAKYFGLSLTTLAGILLIAQLFDAMTDPVVGYLSDCYYERKGNRKAFVVSGGVLLVCCSYFLFNPAGLNATEPYAPVSSLYFLGWLLLFYLAWTLFEIPHLAWGSELATSAQEKNTVFSLRTLGYSLGGLLFYAVPLLPVFDAQGFTPKTLAVSVLVAAVLMLPTLYTSMKTVPGGKVNSAPKASDRAKKNRASLRALLPIITHSKPFLLFLAAFFFAGAGAGMSVGLLYIFADSYLGLGEHLPLIYLLGMGTGILSIAAWHKFAAMFGKTLSWGLGMVVVMMGVLGSALLVPGESGWLGLFVLEVLLSTGSVAIGVFAPAILSDIIDYGTWKFGKDYAGTYFSLYTLVTKANIAIGGAIGLGIAGVYGFDATATQHSAEQVFGLHLAIAYIPAFIILISLIFIVLTPLNARRCGIIRRRLDTRAARAQTHIMDEARTERFISTPKPHAPTHLTETL